ncbi:MAG: RagB/SusD family nutrient uptake outer membrane protein [Edaphocola sp.]
MKKILLLLVVGSAVIYTGCQKFLDKNPKGVLSENEVNTPDGAEQLVIAAYSQLGNDHYDTPYSLWPYGNVRSDDAYKGGRDEADIQNFHFTETFVNTRPDLTEYDNIWYNFYVGVARANTALKVIGNLDENEYPNKQARMGEMRFLRGHFYFMLKIMFKNIPWIDETVAAEDYAAISNTALSNDELWQKIAEDFEFAAANLPIRQDEVGRASGGAAYAYLAKTRLYKAYLQDANHNVTGINNTDMQAVVDACNAAMAAGYALESDFANNFLPGSYENGPESIFAIQFSKDDNTMFGRLNWSDLLATPQGLGCCDFHKPSQNLVNAFKTGTDGLPEFDDYNVVDYDATANTVDPRLDHTVAIPGHPFKYETSRLYEDSWNRSPSIYGYYASLKENVSPDCDCFVNVDPFYANTKNRIQIRLSDVMLFKAEALIELGQQDLALDIINALRTRAANSTALLVDASGSYISLFNVQTYQPGVNCTWTQEYARQALRWERRLELAMEGSRFFDLVRWGVAAETLNSYFSTERTKRSFLSGAAFTKNKNEYLPIPLNQINFSQGVYHQNPGY